MWQRIKRKTERRIDRIACSGTRGTLLFKMMLDVVIDVEDSSLRSITDHINTVRMKEIPGGNIGPIKSYLKGVILLPDN